MVRKQKMVTGLFPVIVVGFLTLLLSVDQSAIGQEDISILTRDGTDPTEARTRLDIHMADVRGLGYGDLFGFRLEGDYAFTRWGSIGISAPFMITDFSGYVEHGLGDIRVDALAVLYNDPGKKAFRSIAAGTGFLTKTGSHETGTGLGMNIISPYLAMSFPYGEEAFMALVIQDYISFAAESDLKEIHELRLQLRGVHHNVGGFWITAQPEVQIDLTGFDYTNIPIRGVIGKMLSNNVGLAAQLTSYVAGESTVDYFASFSLRYLVQ